MGRACAGGHAWGVSSSALEVRLSSAALGSLDDALRKLRVYGRLSREELVLILLDRGLLEVREQPGDLPLEASMLEALVTDVRGRPGRFNDQVQDLFGRGLSVVQVCAVLEAIARA